MSLLILHLPAVLATQLMRDCGRILHKDYNAVAMAPRKCLWSFDLNGIGEMYRSYESHSFWPFLSAPTQGICVTFVRAQHSSYQWSDADLDRLAAYGHCVHILSDAGLAALTHLPLLSNLCGCCIRKGNHVTYSVVAFIFAPDKTWLPLLPFLPYC